MRCFSLLLVLVTCTSGLHESQGDKSQDSPWSHASEEKRLIHDLMTVYQRMGREGRPVKNSSVPVVVEFGLGLIKMELREKENVLVVSTWTRMKWMDEYLTWNPYDYGGVGSIRVAADRIWIPDIMLYNTAEVDPEERKVNAVIQPNGMVSWYPHRVYSSSCAVDVRNFPFDNQTCHLWFGSWTHSLMEMEVKLAFKAGIDLSTFQQVYKDASEWEIENVSAVRELVPPDDPSYAILSFTLYLKRKLMFSTYILTMPAVFLSFLTLLVFWLPPEHADKSALGLTIFGSLLLLLLILVEAAPPTASAVPLLGVYYCFTSVIVILSIFLSSLVVKVGRRGERRKRMPTLLRRIFINGVGRIVCLKELLKCRRKTPQILGMRRTECPEKHLLPSVGPRLNCPEDGSTEGMSHDNSSNGVLDRRLKAIQEMMERTAAEKMERRAKENAVREIEAEWRTLALVLDRIFFLVYLVVTCSSLLALFPRFSRM